MYILDKEKLSEEFLDYQDMAYKLGYASDTSFREDRGANVLDDGVVICPENIRKRLDKNGFQDLYWKIDEQILINSMIYGRGVIANDVMRVVVGIMLNGLTQKPAKIYWTIKELVNESEYKIYSKNVEKLMDSEVGEDYFISKNGEFKLNIKALTQSCK